MTKFEKKSKIEPFGTNSSCGGKVISYFLLLLAASVTRLFSRLCLRLEVIGSQNVPKEVGVLMVANHQTLIDSFFIGAHFLPLGYLALHPKLYLWNTPEFKNFFKTKLMAWIFRHLRCEPVYRGNRDRGVLENTFQRLTEILQNGNLLIFFEGTRTRNGDIGPAKSGVAELIIRAKPRLIVPVKIIGFDQVLPVGSKFVRIGKRVKIIFGQPVDPQTIFPDNETCRKKISARVRELVMNI